MGKKVRLTEKRLENIVREEIYSVLVERDELNFMVKSARIDIFEDALHRDKLDHIVKRLRNNKQGAYYYADLTRKEAEQVAEAIKGYLNYGYADLNYGDQRDLESILNNLPYLMRF